MKFNGASLGDSSEIFLIGDMIENSEFGSGVPDVPEDMLPADTDFEELSTQSQSSSQSEKGITTITISPEKQSLQPRVAALPSGFKYPTVKVVGDKVTFSINSTFSDFPAEDLNVWFDNPEEHSGPINGQQLTRSGDPVADSSGTLWYNYTTEVSYGISKKINYYYVIHKDSTTYRFPDTGYITTTDKVMGYDDDAVDIILGVGLIWDIVAPMVLFGASSYSGSIDWRIFAVGLIPEILFFIALLTATMGNWPSFESAQASVIFPFAPLDLGPIPNAISPKPDGKPLDRFSLIMASLSYYIVQTLVVVFMLMNIGKDIADLLNPSSSKSQTTWKLILKVVAGVALNIIGAILSYNTIGDSSGSAVAKAFKTFYNDLFTPMLLTYITLAVPFAALWKRDTKLAKGYNKGLWVKFVFSCLGILLMGVMLDAYIKL